MQKQWSKLTALAVILLAPTFRADAGTPKLSSGIAGQLVLDQITYPPEPPAPQQTTLSVFVKTGRHFRHLADAADTRNWTSSPTRQPNYFGASNQPGLPF